MNAFHQALLLLLLLSGTSQAVVAIVDATPVTHTFAVNSGAAATYSSAYTVAQSGSDNTLVVVYAARGSTSTDEPTPTSATFGGVPLQVAATQTVNDGIFEAVTSIFYLNQADFGAGFTAAAQDLVVNRAAAGDNGANIGFFTLSGVNQTLTLGQMRNASQIDSNASMDLLFSDLSAESLLVSLASGSFQNSISATSNVDTLLFGPTSDGNLRSVAGLTDVTSGSETVSYTYGSSTGRSSAVGVEFLAASGVPEPSATGLLGLALVGLLSQRRR